MVHTVMRNKGPQQSIHNIPCLVPASPSIDVCCEHGRGGGATEFQLSHTAVCVQAKPLRTCDKSVVAKTSLTFTW